MLDRPAALEVGVPQAPAALRTVLTLMGLTVAGLVGLATSGSALTFFVASFLIGLCATGAQVLLPFAAHPIPGERRGRLVSNIMAGVLTGIMLADRFGLGQHAIGLFALAGAGEALAAS